MEYTSLKISKTTMKRLRIMKATFESKNYDVLLNMLMETIEQMPPKQKGEFVNG